MKKFIVLATTLLMTCVLMACGSKNDNTNTASNEAAKVELSEDVSAALDELYSIQLNYSNGTAPLMVIPPELVQLVYDNWDDIEKASLDNAPNLLREYVDPSVVYFDYDSNYSIIWFKDEANVIVEPTDIEAHEDYKQKAHK